MKSPLLLAAAIAAFALANIAHSQLPGGPQSALQRLQVIKAKNKELIDKQTETLKKLDEIQLESQQIKFLGKRS
jgi:cell shape-determining protein MreC